MEEVMEGDDGDEDDDNAAGALARPVLDLADECRLEEGSAWLCLFAGGGETSATPPPPQGAGPTGCRWG